MEGGWMLPCKENFSFLLGRIKNMIREEEMSVELVNFIMMSKCALPKIGCSFGEGMMWCWLLASFRSFCVSES